MNHTVDVTINEDQKEGQKKKKIIKGTSKHMLTG